MPTWYRMPIIGSFALDIDIAMPRDTELETAWRVLCAGIRERCDDQQSRRRADARARLGISPYQPLNGRSDGQAVHAARTNLLAQERELLREQERLTPDDPRLYLPECIEQRVRLSAERATLTAACEIAEASDVSSLSRQRAGLQFAGTQAAQSRWRQEIQDGLVRLRTGVGGGHDENDATAVDQLRRRLDDITVGRAAVSTEED